MNGYVYAYVNLWALLSINFKLHNQTTSLVKEPPSAHSPQDVACRKI